MRRALLVGALSTVWLAAPAQAFVQRLNDRSQPVFWRETCVPVTIYLNGFERSPNKIDLDVPGIVKSVAAAAHAWSSDAVQCHAGGSPYLEIVPTLAPLDATPPPVAYDAKNSIIFRESDWPHPNEALAATTVTSAPDGHIVDVDVEINASSPLQLWMNLDEGEVPPPPPPNVENGPEFYDLQSALTHELGHFIGLMHTCFRPQDGPRLNDDKDRPVPDCDGTPEDQASVMFPRVGAGETSKRTLSPDDIDAVCTIYAPSRAHEACALDTVPPGCGVAPPRRTKPRAALGAIAGLATLAELVRRRRRRLSARARARA
jgi:hypothetical protein